MSDGAERSVRSKVTYSCSGCRRSFEATLEQVTTRLARGLTRCQLCGAALAFPDAVRTAAGSGAKPRPADAGVDPAEKVTYACRGCRKSFTTTLGTLVGHLHQGRTSCQLCSGALELPPRVGEALAKLRSAGVASTPREVACPACDRVLRTDAAAGAGLTCATCGARFLAPEPGPDGGQAVGRVPGRDGAPASVADVEGAAARAPREGLGLVGDLLRARAALGQLTREELGEVVSVWARLATWEPAPAGPARLPLELRDAEDLAPGLLFPGKAAVVERAAGAAVFPFLVEAGASSSTSTGVGSLILTNTVGLATLATVGVGFFNRGSREPEAGAQGRRRVRLVLEPDPAGGTALRLETQLDADAPVRAPASAQAELARGLATRQGAAMAWAGALALHGGWARGPVAFAVTPVAVRRRLEALGGDLARRKDELAAKLCPGLAT